MSDPIIVFDGRRGVAHAEGVRRPRAASFSSLDLWGSCPGRWLANRLLPDKPVWGSALVAGSIAHAGLELACASPDVNMPDWRDLCARGVRLLRERNVRSGWKDDPIPDGVLKPDGSPAVEEDWVRVAAGKLNGFALSDVFGVRLQPAACEQELRASVFGGIPMSGSVDYRDVERGVVDWKTGRVPSRADGARRHADQLRVYKALLEATGVCEVRAARDMYVEARAWKTADLSEKMMRGTGERMAVAWEGVRASTGVDGSGVFGLSPSGLCGWCPLANVCPVASLPFAAAREAARSALPADDARFGFVKSDPLEGFGLPTASGTHGMGVNGSRLNGGSMGVSFAEMFGGSEQPAAQPASQPAQQPVSQPAQQPSARPAVAPPTGLPAGVGVDPWNPPEEHRETVEAKMNEWGLGWAMQQSEQPAQPAAQPAQQDTQPAVSQPAATPATQPVQQPATGVRVTHRKPFEATWTDNVINVDGYGFTQLTLMSADALLLCGSGHAAHVHDLLLLMIRAEWRAARDAWPEITPDVHKLDTGKPDPQTLFAWLDTPLARDTHRIMMRTLTKAGTAGKTENGDWATLVQLVTAAGQVTRDALRLARSLTA